MYNLPNIQGNTTEEKLQSLIEYTYQLTEQLNMVNDKNDVIQICEEIERILNIDENSLAGNTNARAIIEKKKRLQSIIKNIGG